MWMSILTTVLNISLMIPFIGLLEGRNVQEWKFKANDKLAYLAVTALHQQWVISLLRCDVACSQHPDCMITVYNRSVSLCTKFRLFREQDITPTILTGNFDVRHFYVNAKTPIVPSCFKQPPSLNNAFISPGSKVVGCVRRYTCYHGYRDTSTNTMTANTTCLENLTWSRVSLNCSIPRCLSQPSPVKNANVSNGSQLVGSIRTYMCHHGYRDTSSNQTTANITCLGNLTWSRVALKCLVPSCLSQTPPVKNAYVSDGSQLVGSIRTYTCHHGYRDTSSNQTTANTTCLGNLTWSRVVLKCLVPSCLSQPPPLKNANVSDGSQLVGSIRTYTCHHGYRDTSSNQTTANTTCLGNLTWSRVVLKCLVPSCRSQPPPLKNANVSDGSQLVGSIRTYTCHHGYRDTSSNQTTANITCLGNLTWSRVALKCLVPSCLSQPPPLKNANVSDGSQLVGSIRTYTCHHGYRDTSSNQTTANTTCLGNLTWSRVVLKCLVPSCLSQPPPVINANVSDGSQLVGSIRTYTCHHGYRDTSSNQTTANTTCLGNLTWSRVVLKCLVPSCLSQPPDLQNANVSDGSQLVGSIRTYTCHKGYRDMSPTKGTANSVCLGNLTWSRVTLKCLAERCPSKLPSVQNADVSKGSRNVGSSRKYTCHRGYRDKATGLNIAQTRCLQNLHWSLPNLSCSAQSCPSKPPHIENAHVSGRGNVVGSVRRYTCRKGYMDTSDPKGTNEARCLGNFRWSQPGLRCTGPWIRKETEATRRGRKYVELTEEELKHVFADTTLIFQVKTCHNANINYDKREARKTFKDKISIGGGKNTYWKIFPCYQIKENNIVSCKEFRSFWIKFHGNIVQVGKGDTVGEREVTSCEHKFKVIHLRISTYVRNSGTWLFKIHGG